MNRLAVKLSSVALLLSVLLPMANAEEVAGKRWASNQQVAIDRIDHQPLDTLLQKYVDENGMVDYRSWHQNSEDRQTLKSYLESLSRANPQLASDNKAKLAFWINAYNALTIEGILRVYPTTSIRNHTAKLIGYNIWKKLYLYSGSSRITLDEIEHKVLRKMGEPRIHFAIVCASISCPRLLNRAYTAEKLEQQLVTNTKDFFSRSRNLQIDQRNSKLNISSIMSWFGSDFGGSTNKQIEAIAPYFPDQAKAFVQRGGYRIGYLDYDWGLNAQN